MQPLYDSCDTSGYAKPTKKSPPEFGRKDFASLSADEKILNQFTNT